MLRQTVRRLGATAQRTARVDFTPCLTVYSPQALRDNLQALQAAKSRDDSVIASVAKGSVVLCVVPFLLSACFSINTQYS